MGGAIPGRKAETAPPNRRLVDTSNTSAETFFL